MVPSKTDFEVTGGPKVNTNILEFMIFTFCIQHREYFLTTEL